MTIEVTQDMQASRESLVQIGDDLTIPQDVIDQVVEQFSVMSQTFALTDEQRGWTLMAVANIVGGMAVRALVGDVPEDMKDDEESVLVTQAIGTFVSMLSILIGLAGNRLVVNDELPSLDMILGDGEPDD